MLPMPDDDSNAITLDAALGLNPIGYFHYRLLLMCGLTFMTDALEVTLLSFLSTCAAAEWNLSDAQQATLTGMVFLGIVIGCVFWGRFADKFGRRPAYLYSCVVIIVGGLATAMAPSFVLLVIFRAITGFGIGAASVPFDLLAEFMPVSHRGRFLVYTEFFWTLGSMFVAGMAWVILPYLGWRALAFACVVPIVMVSLLSYFCLPESPRWLLSKHRERDATRVIRDAAALNQLTLHQFTISMEGGKDEDGASYIDLLATKSARGVTLPLWLIWALFGFTYYGLVLFVSRVYTSPGSGADDDERRTSSGAVCDFDYAPIFLSAASEALAVFISSLLIDPLGRKLSQSVFYLVGGLAVFCMGLDWTPGWVLFLSILARMASMSASIATWVATPELFPTPLRASGHSTCAAISKLASFTAPYVVQSRSITIAGVGAVLGVMNLVAAVCAQLLPETGHGELLEGHEVGEFAPSPRQPQVHDNDDGDVDNDGVELARPQLSLSFRPTAVASSQKYRPQLGPTHGLGGYSAVPTASGGSSSHGASSSGRPSVLSPAREKGVIRSTRQDARAGSPSGKYRPANSGGGEVVNALHKSSP